MPNRKWFGANNNNIIEIRVCSFKVKPDASVFKIKQKQEFLLVLLKDVEAEQRRSQTGPPDYI